MVGRSMENRYPDRTRNAGAMLFDEEGIFWAPAFPLEDIVDPTGAGDSFAGGLVSFQPGPILY